MKFQSMSTPTKHQSAPFRWSNADLLYSLDQIFDFESRNYEKILYIAIMMECVCDYDVRKKLFYTFWSVHYDMTQQLIKLHL